MKTILSCLHNGLIIFLVWLQKRLLSFEFEPVLSHTEKSRIVSSNKPFSPNIKINIFGLQGPLPFGVYKIGFNLKIFQFKIRESCLQYDAINRIK